MGLNVADHRPFFLVWSPTGPTSPRVRHSTRDEAKQVAESMARTHRGQEFFVVVATDRFVATDVTHTQLVGAADDDIPF